MRWQKIYRVNQHIKNPSYLQAASSSSASADDRFSHLSNEIYGLNEPTAAIKKSVVFPNKIHFPKTSRRLPQVRFANSFIMAHYYFLHLCHSILPLFVSFCSTFPNSCDVNFHLLRLNYLHLSSGV